MAIKTFAEILRDYETNGVPSSGVHKVSKSDFREALSSVESLIATGAKVPVAVKTIATTNIALSTGLENGDTVGGVVVATGEIAVLTGQTDPTQNGPYTVVASGAASRTTGFTTGADLLQATFYATSGTNAGQVWAVRNTTAPTIGVTDISITFAYDYSNLDITDLSDRPGIYPLSSVAGTSTAYTATAPAGVGAYVTGDLFLFIPDEDNGGAATLNVSGLGAVAIADANGQALVAGMLKASVPVILRKEASIFRILGTFIHPEVRGNLKLYSAAHVIGAAGAIDRYLTTADTTPRERFLIGEDYFDFYGGGDGTTAATFIARIAADGTITTIGQFMADGGRPAYHAANMPTIAKTGATGIDTARIMSGPRQAFRNIANTQPRNVNEATPIFVSGRDVGKIITVTGASRIIDLTGLPNGGSIDIITDATGASASIFGGLSANWRGRTAGHHTLTIGADTHIRVLCITASDYIVTELRGTLTGSNGTAPAARASTIVVMGESHAQYFGSYGGFAGLQERMGELSLSKSIWPVNCGFGGAAIMEGFGSDGTNHFWNTAGTPGARATLSLTRIQDAIAAGQPAPADVLFIIGENELDNLTTASLITDWKAAAAALIAWFRTQLSLPNLRFHWVPLGSDDYSGTLDTIYSAIREGQLDVIAADANILQGPEMYDLSRAYEDTHLDFEGQYQLGRRFADHVDNAANAATNNLGPNIVGVTEINSSQYEIEINANGTASILPPLQDWAQGFALIDTGSPIGQTVKAIKQFAWGYSGSTYKLTVYLSSAATGARVIYPWGKGDGLRTNLIQDAFYKPLRSYAG